MNHQQRVESYVKGIQDSYKEMRIAYGAMMSYLDKLNEMHMTCEQMKSVRDTVCLAKRRINTYRKRMNKIMYYKEDVYDTLGELNRIMQQRDLYASLRVVGGAALILNGVHSVYTQDIDTIIQLEDAVREAIDDAGVDINNDSMEYIQNYDGLEFVYDHRHSFSNLELEYLDLAGCVKTKMLDTNPDKLQSLREVMEEDLGIPMNVNAIVQWGAENGVTMNEQDVNRFLQETE